MKEIIIKFEDQKSLQDMRGTLQTRLQEECFGNRTELMNRCLEQRELNSTLQLILLNSIPEVHSSLVVRDAASITDPSSSSSHFILSSYSF